MNHWLLNQGPISFLCRLFGSIRSAKRLLQSAPCLEFQALSENELRPLVGTLSRKGFCVLPEKSFAASGTNCPVIFITLRLTCKGRGGRGRRMPWPTCENPLINNCCSMRLTQHAAWHYGKNSRQMGSAPRVCKCLMRLEEKEISLEKEEESIVTFPPPFHDDSRRFPGRRNSGV